LSVELGSIETDEAVENPWIERAVEEGILGKFLQGLRECGLAVGGSSKFEMHGEAFLDVEVFGVSAEGRTSDAEAQARGFGEGDACGDFVEGQFVDEEPVIEFGDLFRGEFGSETVRVENFLWDFRDCNGLRR
jgi:hypothetical protein